MPVTARATSQSWAVVRLPNWSVRRTSRLVPVAASSSACPRIRLVPLLGTEPLIASVSATGSRDTPPPFASVILAVVKGTRDAVVEPAEPPLGTTTDTDTASVPSVSSPGSRPMAVAKLTTPLRSLVRVSTLPRLARLPTRAPSVTAGAKVQAAYSVQSGVKKPLLRVRVAVMWASGAPEPSSKV